MPDKKLTDSEIVKDCKRCFHYEACKGTYYSAKGNEDILYEFEGEMYGHSGCDNFEDKDLINRLQADCENYKKVAEHQQSVTMDRGFEIKRLKKKIESLQEKLSEAEDTIQFADKELKKANTENEKMRKGYEEVLKGIEEAKVLVARDIINAKAEAYKEFADRLIAEYAQGMSWFRSKEVCYVAVQDIRNLLKELVGDSNGG